MIVPPPLLPTDPYRTHHLMPQQCRYLVRFLLHEEGIPAASHRGSGVIIGGVPPNWLVIASAAHVFQWIKRDLANRDKLPIFQYHDEYEIYEEEFLRPILVGIQLRDGREMFGRIRVRRSAQIDIPTGYLPHVRVLPGNAKCRKH